MTSQRGVVDADPGNHDQARAWNGPEGAHWAARPETGPAGFAGSADPTGEGDEITRRLLAAAGIGDRDVVLDIGCGTGETTRLAAYRAARGRVVGIDLSAPMLDQARRLTAAAGLTNVSYLAGDAQIHPLPAATFDLAISRFGTMFFADPVAAFGNIGRALRPGGRLLFLCPREMARNDWYVVPMTALTPPPLPESGMFALADPDHVRDLLARAGLAQVTLTPVDDPMDFGPELAAATSFFLGSGPVRALLENPAGPTPHQAEERLTAALRRYAGPGGVRIPAATWLVSAVRPESAGRR
ncbi:class I SAM-dependent methyltransferase [Solwaraspora sp. WMMD1047]|uniref:class I SAM-dependent methyltransferase n=1 Tax=Solwaraspora sp. WMMD1047 TaxID=3016102 RepID=UPI0024173F39|nr:class I SAM-dependent methyltransferase [Solwaraspora sp. WMMD1047]MDG4830151.1 class I SAM-dependent methyltransferase [Solwaraspora sp. WMMD1047]